MPARYRLTRAAITLLSKARARRIPGEYVFCLVYRTPSGLRGPKATFVASKKVSPKAVARNRVERRGRAILSPLMKIAPEDMVIIFQAKKEAMDASPADLARDIGKVFERATLG